MKRERIRSVLAMVPQGQAVTVAGWVRTRRDSKGGFSFLEVNDGSCVRNLQVVVDGTLPNYPDEVLKLFPGCSVIVTGSVVASRGSGQTVELRAREVRVVGSCDPLGYPLQKQKVSFERLRELAHLRGRTATFGAVARLRHVLAMATHECFQDRGFFYLQTPIITASDCEGAGRLFQVTTLPLESRPQERPLDYAEDFFGRKTYLTVSGQLEAEAYACALGQVYTFGPTFRAEPSTTRRHLAEFWMVEPEMAFADLDDDIRLAEEYVRHLCVAVLEKAREELDFFDRRVVSGVAERVRRVAETPFCRMSYTEVVALLDKAPVAFEYPPRWGMDLQTEHERYLTETYCRAPLVVTDFPRSIKPFYMRVNDDGRTVAAMDVLLPDVGEIVGGSQREERLDVLEQRMREAGLDTSAYEWYLDLRRYGTVPHAGFGLGFERMVLFCSGLQNIRDTIPFPRTLGHAEF